MNGLLIHGLAEVVQPTLLDHSIDLVFSDSCYGLGKVYGDWRETDDAETHWRNHRPIWDDWFRLVKPGGVVAFFQARNRWPYDNWVGAHSLYILNTSKRKGCRVNWDTDLCILQTADRKPLPSGNLYNQCMFGEGDCVPGMHPCPKPLAGMEYLIKLLCPPGGVVYDPYMGSATIPLAALRCGRKTLGVERYRPFFDYAVTRFKDYKLATVDDSAVVIG